MASPLFHMQAQPRLGRTVLHQTHHIQSVTSPSQLWNPHMKIWSLEKQEGGNQSHLQMEYHRQTVWLLQHQPHLDSEEKRGCSSKLQLRMALHLWKFDEDCIVLTKWKTIQAKIFIQAWSVTNFLTNPKLYESIPSKTNNMKYTYQLLTDRKSVV